MEKNKYLDYAKNAKAITLIALIITIIVLLILAGVTLSLTLGEKGIFKIFKQAGITYEEKQAKEKLELVLLDLQASKVTDPTYNETEYINHQITKNEMIISGDIVFVDGWQFEIDRTVPQIASSLGKGDKFEQIQINLSNVISSDYVKSTVTIEITYEKEITNIIINGEEVALIPEPIKQNGKNVYILEKEERNNRKYCVIAKDTDKYNMATIDITDITEDMEIWNKKDLEAFRDKVNSGRTFEGKTAKLMDNINLEGSEENQWIPIGTLDIKFVGTFEGNYHKISNIYINNKYYCCGLFGYNFGTIQNVILENEYIYNKYYELNNASYTGGIAGSSCGKIINCGNENSTLIAYRTTGNIDNKFPTTFCGGILGSNDGEILNCYNKATIEAYSVYNRNSPFLQAIAGGIAGYNSSKIINCYNRGNIKSDGGYSVSGGIVGIMANGMVENSYNTGSMTTLSGIKENAGIIARNGWGPTNPKGDALNNWCTTATQYSYKNFIASTTTYDYSTVGRISEDELKTYSSQLGSSYTKDELIDDGIWKYNNGYPILTWQALSSN